MAKLKPSERTERRVQMFIDRGIYKQKVDVLDAAVELLVRHQMELESKKQAESYKQDENVQKLQMETINARR